MCIYLFIYVIDNNLIFWISVLPNWGRSREVADLLVTNGTIYTSDSSLPFADSMALRNGQILRIGNYSSVQVYDFMSF